MIGSSKSRDRQNGVTHENNYRMMGSPLPSVFHKLGRRSKSSLFKVQRCFVTGNTTSFAPIASIHKWHKNTRSPGSNLFRSEFIPTQTQTPLTQGLSLSLSSGCDRCGKLILSFSPQPITIRTISISNVYRHPTDGKSRKCWKCGGDTHPAHELFFCVCGVVQKPAEELTYFDIFQVEQDFDIDVKLLGQLYRDTQSRLHPDKFSTKSHEEQSFAEEQSALLNKAYNTLLKPLSRAIYMLELENITIEENDSNSDPEFLMDIMTFNERISTASCPEDIDQLFDMNEEKIAESVSLISKSFKNKDIPAAKNFTIKLRYYKTIQERIKELRIKNLG